MSGLIRGERRGGPGDDGGWVVAEVVIAAAVLFFVATALLGLVGASTTLSATAKADGIAVNRVNSFIESVRALPYAEITQTKLNTLATQASGSQNGVTMQVSVVVTPKWLDGQNQSIAPPAYKHIRVTVVAEGPSGGPITVSAGTFVRPGGGTGSTDDSDTTEPSVPAPTVVLSSGTPRSGVVWGPASMGMSSESGGGGVTLAYLQMTAGGRLVLEKASGGSADATSGVWNTTLWPDGVIEMRAQARDSLSQLGDVAWSLMIDNIPAAKPTQPTLVQVVGGNAGAVFEWRDTSQTVDPALSYRIVTEQWNMSGVLVPSEVIQNATVGTDLFSYPLTTAPFSRYRVTVYARGPRAHYHNHLASESAPIAISRSYVSRPALTGTTVYISDAGKVNTKAILKLNLACDAPTFAATGATYRWQYKYGPAGTWTTLASTTGPSYSNAAWTVPTNGKISDNPVSFRCVVTLTPLSGSTRSIPTGERTFTGSAIGNATPGPDNWARWVSPPTITPAIDWTRWLM